MITDKFIAEHIEKNPVELLWVLACLGSSGTPKMDRILMLLAKKLELSNEILKELTSVTYD